MKKEPEIIRKIADLKRIVGQVINNNEDWEFPVKIELHEGMEFPKYRITVEMLDEDFFIDNKGKKWKLVENEE